MLDSRHAPLWRRLLAWVYDALVALAIAFVGSFAVLPLTGGRAVPAGNHLYQLWLLLLLAAYFWLSWRFGGQTLGMRAWRLRVTAADGGRPSSGALCWRLLFGGLLGLPLVGYLSSLVRSDRQALHDLASRTATRLLATAG
ncbi:MAG: RDD family protein [Xanthomonadales bacterium]|nr:RDD family protein [Xanthomonadales bacterium]MCB1642466.1 RDD family protein [Xanthomonadales bacterium]